MNQRTARALGKQSGIEVGERGDFTPEGLDNEDDFTIACYKICENKRQYAGHPSYEMTQQPNSDTLFEAFEAGESIGIREAWRTRKRNAKLKPQTPNTTEKRI